MTPLALADWIQLPNKKCESEPRSRSRSFKSERSSADVCLWEKKLSKYLCNKSTDQFLSIRLSAAVVTGTLTLCTLGKIFSRRLIEILFLFFPENRI